MTQQIDTVSGPVTVSVIRVPQRVVVQGVGARGPTGRTGAPGAAGAPGGQFLEHVQAVPAATWTIAHGFGRRVHVAVYDAAGAVVLTDVEHPSGDVAVVIFPAPTVGAALIT